MLLWKTIRLPYLGQPLSMCTSSARTCPSSYEESFFIYYNSKIDINIITPDRSDRNINNIPNTHPANSISSFYNLSLQNLIASLKEYSPVFDTTGAYYSDRCTRYSNGSLMQVARYLMSFSKLKHVVIEVFSFVKSKTYASTFNYWQFAARDILLA